MIRKALIFLIPLLLSQGMQAQLMVYSDHDFPVNGEATAMHFSAGERFLACGTDKGSVHIWDLKARKQLRELKHGGRINAVYIDSQEQYVVSAGDNKVLIIWDLYSGEKHAEVRDLKAKLNHLSVSPDERTLAVSGSKKEIYLLHFPDGNLSGSLRNGHEKEVLFSAFSPDGGQIVSIGSDQQMVYWDPGTRSMLRKIEISPRTINESGISVQAAALTPDGRKILVAYEETRLAKGGQSMIFRHNTALYNWKSGMLEEIFEDHVKKIESLSLTPDGRYYIVDNSTLSLKKINFRELRSGDVVKSENITQEVSSIRLSGNGEWMALGEGNVRLYKLSGMAEPVAANPYPRKEIEEPGKPAATSGGFTLGGGSSTPLFSGKYYALIIGINEYDDPMINDLQAPLEDAESLFNILSGAYNFQADNILFLKNPKRAEIIDALDQLERSVSPEDNLLIFYAGHGHWDENTHKGYWLPSDASHESTANWFRNSSLTGYVSSINSRHTLLIADACFSGSIFQTRAAFSRGTRAVERLYDLNSRKAMTSGTLKEVPDESVFLQYLMKRLEDNQEDYLASEQLFYSLKPAVLNNSSNVPQFGEIKNAGDEGGDFIFVRRK